MREQKDINLINIYLKIHNKKILTMDDLAYLAWYNPECFQKTCDNLIYKIPETKKLVDFPEPRAESGEIPDAVQGHAGEFGKTDMGEAAARSEQRILQFLQNLKKIEVSDVDAVQSVDVAEVKELVGNLFMENLFPHSGLPGYFDACQVDPAPTFNARA